MTSRPTRGVRSAAKGGSPNVTCVYGDELGPYAGRVKPAHCELADMAREYGEFWVFVGEVCEGCTWNHLTVSYVLGHGTRPRSRRGPMAKGS
ncbi:MULTISPECIES: DUF5318 family protein [Thermomonospora]|uniref:DUF5318 family protein n=1 Tax=Thermomonospora TaxID=2019 RepID=UPI001C26B68F